MLVCCCKHFVSKISNLYKIAFVSETGSLRFKLGSVKLDAVLPTARHRCDISSNEAGLPWHNDADMGPINS